MSAQLSPGPRPTAAYIGGSGWTVPFKQYLEDRAVGSSAYGVRVWSGFEQTGTACWIGLNQISVSFNDDMVVGLDDLSVRGVNVASYPVASVRYDFEPDRFTGTATWTLARPIIADRVVAEVDADEGGVYGRTSDVNFDEDGDLTPGGDLRLRVDVLGGDVTGNEVVNAIDLADVKQKLNRRAGDGVTGPGQYNVFVDVTADGVINALDVAAVKQRLSTRLPSGEPSGAVAPQSPSPLRGMSEGNDLFGSSPVLWA